jgi:hypothetical protein
MDEDLKYRLVIGNRTLVIPDELIDFDDFIRTMLQLYPTITKNENVKVPVTFKAGQLNRIAKSLKTYPEIERLAKDAGVTKEIATALGQLYVNDGLSLELSEFEGWLNIVTDPKAKEEAQRLWDELVNE